MGEPFCGRVVREIQLGRAATTLASDVEDDAAVGRMEPEVTGTLEVEEVCLLARDLVVGEPGVRETASCRRSS
ncbi:MAG: hypothetical protein QOK08_776 [Actinomycetota bacterium]|jgi:hypothetical protein|nr:hypothetical protein [Actinomycetota bacterium]